MSIDDKVKEMLEKEEKTLTSIESVLTVGTTTFVDFTYSDGKSIRAGITII